MHPIFSGSRHCVALSALALACMASPAQAAKLLTFEPCLTVEEETYILEHLGQRDMARPMAGRPMKLSYSMVDLDGDGVFEIAVRASADDQCEGVCRTALFMKTGRQWRKMLDTNAAEIAVGERRQFGIRNLLVGDVVMVWTGTRYVAAH